MKMGGNEKEDTMTRNRMKMGFALIGTRRALALAGLVPALALTLALSGCSSPNPVLYTIAPVSGAPTAAATQNSVPAVVVLQQIGLARYLERSQIVLSSENYRLDVAANDWWGEPLSSMLSRVLIDELGQRLPKSTILGENGAVSASADATVALNISRLDMDATGNLILQAQASVTSKNHDADAAVTAGAPVLQSFRFSVAPTGPGVPGQVAAISNALGQLADKLAVMILTGSTTK